MFLCALDLFIHVLYCLLTLCNYIIYNLMYVLLCFGQQKILFLIQHQVPGVSDETCNGSDDHRRSAPTGATGRGGQSHYSLWPLLYLDRSGLNASSMSVAKFSPCGGLECTSCHHLFCSFPSSPSAPLNSVSFFTLSFRLYVGLPLFSSQGLAILQLFSHNLLYIILFHTL